MPTFNFKLSLKQTYHALFRSKGTHFQLSPRRILVLILFYVLFPMVEISNWLGFFLDDLLFPRYREQRLKNPVFVLGNYRSGTTFLHRLLAKDRRMFTSMEGWEIFIAPSITQRKILSFWVSVDHLLGGHVLKWLDHLWQGNVQSQVTFHKLGVREPEEDEGLLAHIWSGIIPWNMFPIMENGSPNYAKFDTMVSEKEKQRVMNFYKRCLQRHVYAYGGKKIYLSKSPSFSASVDSIYKTFPDARIIYLVRNPLEVVPSALNMWAFKWHVTCSPTEKYPYRDEVLDMMKYWYEHPLERLRKASPNSYRIIRFEELIEDPERIVRQIYQHFRLPLRPAYARKLRRETLRSRRSSRKSSYSLAEMGLTRNRVAKEFSAIINRFWFSEAGKKRRQVRKLNQKKKIAPVFFGRRKTTGLPAAETYHRVVRRNTKHRMVRDMNTI